ncbi:hypothetical protein [Micromonospora sp. NPDC049679]|uniref:hypothetical protein n=1 Tax=Micromonospora sp. NPDC049679 TaxID=3155920 RepID=UPI0033F2C4D5
MGSWRALFDGRHYHGPVPKAINLRRLAVSALAAVILLSVPWLWTTRSARGATCTKSVRDYFASGKALWDAVRRRPPAVSSPENPAVHDALRS